MSPGDVLADRFVIDRLAGSGGMGTVYRAFDRVVGTHVALKVLKSEGTDDARFAREARVLADVNHPSIVRHVAHGYTVGGQPFLAMEWLEGEDLSQLLARERPTVAQSLALARRVSEGLAAVHARGVVHRDVKPSNVFLVGGEPTAAKLLDFGIARLQLATPTQRMTGTGVLLGTVGYMSPEQATADDALDARSDVFSLGCVLFECLTGTQAFSGAHVVAILAKVLHGDAPRVRQLRPDLPQSLDDLVARMLSKSKKTRLPDCSAVLEELNALGSIPSAVSTSVAPSSVALSGGEQRLVTVMLVLAQHHHERVNEVVNGYAGQVARLANGVLLVTLGARGSASEQVLIASDCALAVRQAVPDARIALALGSAQTSGSATSPVIDRAAALLADSKSAGIRVDGTTAGLLGARFQVAEHAGAYTLVTQEVEVESPRTLLGKPTPCVGRDRELSLLEGTLRECVEDSVARAILVTAPAGQGKSRLRHEFVRKVQEGGPEPLILIARGDPVGAGSAFALARQLLRRATGWPKGEARSELRAKVQARLARIAHGADLDWVGEFVCELLGAPWADDPSTTLRAARGDPAIMAEWLRRAFIAWLDAECAGCPLLIVLEDVHWGDQPSLMYLGEALRQLSERPLMVLALARPDVHDAFPNLWAGTAMLEVPLRVLSRRATERLVRAVLPDVPAETLARIVDRAAGNAFYIEELIRRVAEGGGDQLPETVLALAQSRLDRLEPEPRRILRAASIFGEVLWSGGVAALLGAASEQAGVEHWLRALVERELLVPGRGEKLSRGREYTFRHGLLREVAYSMLTDDDRVVGHRLVAEWLESAGESDAVTMAGHFERGGEPARAIPWLLRATHTALNGGDVDAVVEFGNRGIACGPNDADKGLLRAAQTHAMGSRGDWAAVVELGLEGMRLLPVASTPWFLCASGVFIAGTFLGDLSLTAQLLPTMMDESIRPEPSIPYGIAVVACCVALSVVGQVDLALSIVERAEATAKAGDGDPAFVLRLLNARAYVELVREEIGAGLGKLSRAFTLAERLGDAHGLALGSMQIVLYRIEIGDFERAEIVACDCVAFSRRLGSTHYTGWNQYYLARGKVSARRPAEAIALLEPLLDHKYSNMSAYVRSLLAYALVEGGDAQRAAREATTVIDGGFMYPGAQCTAFGALASLELSGGRPDRAIDIVERGFAVAHASWPLERTILHLIRAQSMHALGKADERRAAIRDARDRVLRVAATLDEPALRNLYLTNIDSNARTLALAGEWLGEDLALAGAKGDT